VDSFQKRVALVEKWHTDLTKSLDDMYDLAEQVLDVWNEAERHTEQRIIKLLEIGGPIEAIICDYWGNPDFDKDDALVLIEQAIRGEK